MEPLPGWFNRAHQSPKEQPAAILPFTSRSQVLPFERVTSTPFGIASALLHAEARYGTSDGSELKLPRGSFRVGRARKFLRGENTPGMGPRRKERNLAPVPFGGRLRRVRAL